MKVSGDLSSSDANLHIPGTEAHLFVFLQPHRMRMAHNLIVNYGMYKQMDVFVSISSQSISVWNFASEAGWQPAAVHIDVPHIESPLQRPVLVDGMEMTRFHSDDYINFLRVITPDNMHEHLRALQRCEFHSKLQHPT